MKQITVSHDANQQFSIVLGGRRVTFRIWYNPTPDRWSLTLSIDDLPVLRAQRIVNNVDLLRLYQRFGIGSLICVPIVPGSIPDRENLPNGNCRIYTLTAAEIDAAISA